MVSSMSISMARGSCVMVSQQKISTKNLSLERGSDAAATGVSAASQAQDLGALPWHFALAFYLGSSCRPCSCSLGQFILVLVFLFFLVLVVVVFFLVRVIDLDLFKHG